VSSVSSRRIASQAQRARALDLDISRLFRKTRLTPPKTGTSTSPTPLSTSFAETNAEDRRLAVTLPPMWAFSGATKRTDADGVETLRKLRNASTRS
jgi:hypothetical protein